MTDDEDRENERKNEIISRCDHDIVKFNGKWCCMRCEVTVCFILLPRKSKPLVIDESDLF